jgi:hypothetical protein
MIDPMVSGLAGGSGVATEQAGLTNKVIILMVEAPAAFSLDLATLPYPIFVLDTAR